MSRGLLLGRSRHRPIAGISVGVFEPNAAELRIKWQKPTTRKDPP